MLTLRCERLLAPTVVRVDTWPSSHATDLTEIFAAAGSLHLEQQQLIAAVVNFHTSA